MKKKVTSEPASGTVFRMPLTGVHLGARVIKITSITRFSPVTRHVCRWYGNKMGVMSSMYTRAVPGYGCLSIHSFTHSCIMSNKLNRGFSFIDVFKFIIIRLSAVRCRMGKSWFFMSFSSEISMNDFWRWRNDFLRFKIFDSQKSTFFFFSRFFFFNFRLVFESFLINLMA